ncbi:hypothetical protein SAMN05192563_1004267 [Paraburkholderia aspalathi]|uniref:Uncharacterized protein n=1 Tax=Paraburkholderia aspalathi TaxID=1324617 RepID=A0A1I7B878_9BURK|nr:hypothetical protein SAMN05192563_1004267 [Paraburkholderia aspalathi]
MPPVVATKTDSSSQMMEQFGSPDIAAVVSERGTPSRRAKVFPGGDSGARTNTFFWRQALRQC